MFRTSFGRRLWKQAGDETTLFFYSDEGLVAEYDPTGAEIRSYGYQPDSTWTTGPLWLKENGEYYFYHNDHLGTPQKLVKQNGAVVWSASYTAFGQATIEVETVTNNLRFPGQYYDAETGGHYNCFRYYAPDIGRYLRKDPIGLAGGINLFSYTGDNPVILGDPWGLVCCTTFFACLDKCYQFMNADFFALLGGYVPGKAGNFFTLLGKTPLWEIFGGNFLIKGISNTFGYADKLCGASKIWLRNPLTHKFLTFTNFSNIKIQLRFPWRLPPAGASIAGNVIWAWKIGTGLGCAGRCSFNHCAYDYDVIDEKRGFLLTYLLLEGIPEGFHHVMYHLKGLM